MMVTTAGLTILTASITAESSFKVRFVEPDSPKALATSLLSLLANPKALEVFKATKNPLMEHFKWKNIANKYVKVYRDVLKK